MSNEAQNNFAYSADVKENYIFGKKMDRITLQSVFTYKDKWLKR